MTPFALDGGGTVFVNRGFVPQPSRRSFAAGTPADGAVTVTGVARAAEAAGSFTPGADTANRIEWVRNPARLAAMAGTGLQPVAPVTIDAARRRQPARCRRAAKPSSSFPNNHLGYAMTWFGFALIPPSCWLWRCRQAAGQPEACDAAGSLAVRDCPLHQLVAGRADFRRRITLMQFVSTRGEAPALGFSDAVLAGLARDGGLYVPETWPQLDAATRSPRFAGRPYAEVAVDIIAPLRRRRDRRRRRCAA